MHDLQFIQYQGLQKEMVPPTWAYLTPDGSARYFVERLDGSLEEVPEGDTNLVYTGEFDAERFMSLPGIEISSNFFIVPYFWSSFLILQFSKN